MSMQMVSTERLSNSDSGALNSVHCSLSTQHVENVDYRLWVVRYSFRIADLETKRLSSGVPRMVCVDSGL